MERLYSGPLSEPAQKILAVLRAQSRRAARNHYSNSNYSHMESCYSSQRERQAQSSRSTDRDTDRPWSRPLVSSSSCCDSSPHRQSSQPPACYQSSQTPDCSQSSQASSSFPSSCRDSSFQRQSCQTPVYYQCSQTYSQREYSQPDRAAAFTQSNVSQTRAWHTSPKDRYTLSLQTPQTLAQRQDPPWRNSTKETRTTFMLNLSPEDQGPDESFFSVTEHPVARREEPALACDPVPSCIKISLVSDSHTSGTQRENWPDMKGTESWNVPKNELEHTVARNRQPKGQTPPSDTAEVASSGGEDGGLNQSLESETIKTGRLVLPSRYSQETDCDRQVHEPIRGLDWEEGVRRLEKGLMAGTGQIPEGGRELQNGENGVLWTEIGCRDAGLLDEKESANKIGVLVKGTNGVTRLERDLDPESPTDTMDTTFGCDTEGTKLGQDRESDLGGRGDVVETEGHELEEKEISWVHHNDSPDKIPLSVERGDHKVTSCQAENPQNVRETEQEKYLTEEPQAQAEPIKMKVDLGYTAVNLERNTEEGNDVMEGGLEVEKERTIEQMAEARTEEIGKERWHCSAVQLRDGRGETEDSTGGNELPGKNIVPEETWTDRDESLMTAAAKKSESASTEDSCTRGRPTPRLSHEGGARGLGFRAPSLRGNPLPEIPLHLHDNVQSASRRGSNVGVTPANPSNSVQDSSSDLGLASASVRARGRSERRNLLPSQIRTMSHHPHLIASFSLKRKYEDLLPQSDNLKISQTRRLAKWEPPRSSQGKGARSQTSTPQHPGLLPAQCQTQASAEIALEMDTHTVRQTRQRQGQRKPALLEETGLETTGDASKNTQPSMTSKPSRQKRARCGPDRAPNGPRIAQEGANSSKPQSQSRAACLTAAVTSDPRVKDAGRLNPEERMLVLEEAGRAGALVLTMVYQDGSTQLDPEQKLTPPVCGLLVLIKTDMDRGTPEDSLGPNDSLVYLKLEHTPAWAQQHTHHCQELFTREMLLQVLSSSQLVVCYKAKDLLRTALQFYRRHLNWKQVAGCRIQDPQVSGWLLDPTDPASCYQDLLAKHYRRPSTTPALGTKKVSQVVSNLSLLYWLNMELCSKLQGQGLWELYSNMELSMIPVLAAMESHHIHVDKEALKRTSDLLGTKMKQLEQEAHQAAGQIFLVSSSTQLRTVLFEKLRLHERCENKKLPKTINKQQQSTSEAALLQLQDLHPLPKIILEYRQVHKIKSTFVDGILSCMMSKNYISSTWHQTSVVTGRISAKHPNFQALPRQPVQITKKQYIQGKEMEVVTVHPRAMFIPQEGWTFLAADFCQVELRLLAHLSCDPELLRVFTDPQADVFTMLASQWKGVSEGEVTSEEREHAKRIVYSVVYGAGRERLSEILGVSAEQASRFQDSFLQTYREVQTFIQRTIQQCHKQGHVLSIMGRRRSLPNIHSSDWSVRMQAERQAVNFVVQGSAADLCKMAMIRIFSQVSSSSSLSARLIAQLHDELLYEVEDGQVEEFAAVVKNTMESLQHIDSVGVHLKVPLKVALSGGKSWGSMSELRLPTTPPSASPPLSALLPP